MWPGTPRAAWWLRKIPQFGRFPRPVLGKNSGVGMTKKLISATVAVAGAMWVATGLIHDLPHTVPVDDGGWSQCTQIGTGRALTDGATGCVNADGSRTAFDRRTCRDGRTLLLLPDERFTAAGVIRQGGTYLQERAVQDCLRRPPAGN